MDIRPFPGSVFFSVLNALRLLFPPETVFYLAFTKSGTASSSSLRLYDINLQLLPGREIEHEY